MPPRDDLTRTDNLSEKYFTPSPLARQLALERNVLRAPMNPSIRAGSLHRGNRTRQRCASRGRAVAPEPKPDTCVDECALAHAQDTYTANILSRGSRWVAQGARGVRRVLHCRMEKGRREHSRDRRPSQRDAGPVAGGRVVSAAVQRRRPPIPSLGRLPADGDFALDFVRLSTGPTCGTAAARAPAT
jgi:hypothetical protein